MEPLTHMQQNPIKQQRANERGRKKRKNKAMELLPECRLTLRSKWKWCTLLQHRLTHAWCQPGCFLTFDYTYAGSLDFHFGAEKDLAGIKTEVRRKSFPYAAEHLHFSKQRGNRDCEGGKKMKGWMGEWKREGWLLLSNSGNGESSIGGVTMNEVI